MNTNKTDKIIAVVVLNDICEYYKLKVQDVGILVTKNKDLYVNGVIDARDPEYRYQGNIGIMVDIYSDNNKVIYTLKDYATRDRNFVYGSFSTLVVDITRFFNLTDITKIVVYPYVS